MGGIEERIEKFLLCEVEDELAILRQQAKNLRRELTKVEKKISDIETGRAKATAQTVAGMIWPWMSDILGIDVTKIKETKTIKYNDYKLEITFDPTQIFIERPTIYDKSYGGWWKDTFLLDIDAKETAIVIGNYDPERDKYFDDGGHQIWRPGISITKADVKKWFNKIMYKVKK